MTPACIAFVTATTWSDLDPDDHPVVAALTGRGHTVDPVIWDDPAADWGAFDIVVLRSCWDYHEKPAEFRAWIDHLEDQNVPLWNPAVTLRWNLDKIYLRDLSEAGVSITPTQFPEPGATLAEIMSRRGWDDVVIKPRVSASGHRTMRASAAHADATLHQAELDDLLTKGGALVQEYLPGIERDGEWSLIFLGGRFSHAVRKRPAPGEFRVQVQYGGTTDAAEPGPQLIAQAEKIIGAVRLPWLYARVDGCVVDGSLLLMELEMLEPSLFQLQHLPAADRFADVIEACLNEARRKSAIVVD